MRRDLRKNYIFRKLFVYYKKLKSYFILNNLINKLKYLISRIFIKVKKISKDDNTIYMEYVPYNLDKIITGKYPKTLHQFNKVKIITNFLEGLKSLHDNGIIHNDFKAKNIQVTENSDVRIIDFDSSDFGLKSITKRTEDINKAKIIILQIINKRTYNYILKNKDDFLNKIEDEKMRTVMEFGRNNLSELINYVKKMKI